MLTEEQDSFNNMINAITYNKSITSLYLISNDRRSIMMLICLLFYNLNVLMGSYKPVSEKPKGILSIYDDFIDQPFELKYKSVIFSSNTNNPKKNNRR